MKVAVLAFAALLWVVLAGLSTARRSAAKYAQPGGRVEYQELSWSPDGRRISFTSRRDGNWDVYVMNADGSRPARLTDDPASDLYSTWSPDGKKIAFGSKRGGKFDIYVMGADGSNPTRLTGGAGDSTFPSWSPDGKRIAYMSNAGGKWQIYLVNAGGSGRRRVTVSSGNDYNPSWSPDGSRLAFESDRDGGDIDEIYTIGADGRRERRITYNNAEGVNDVFPTWYARRRISYSSVKNRRADVYVVSDDGSNPTLLIEKASYARWSPDKSEIAYISQGDGGASAQIYVMNADGSNRRRLTR